MLRKLLFDDKYWKPYKFSIIDFCMFQTPDCQFISTDLIDYPFVKEEVYGVVDVLLVYSHN